MGLLLVAFVFCLGILLCFGFRFTLDLIICCFRARDLLFLLGLMGCVVDMLGLLF